MAERAWNGGIRAVNAGAAPKMWLLCNSFAVFALGFRRTVGRISAYHAGTGPLSLSTF